MQKNAHLSMQLNDCCARNIQFQMTMNRSEARGSGHKFISEPVFLDLHKHFK